MNYEEKYKEVFKRAEAIIRFYKNQNRDDETSIKDLELIFPELKESEDERIRKGIFKALSKKDARDVLISQGIEVSDALAWLEKQAEKKPILDFKAKDWYVSKVDGKIHNIYHSVDKVEPKFKVGDWVVQGCNILKIRCVGDEYYCFETVGGYVDDMLVSEIDSLYHLWTIKDAKDGDVLVADNRPFIYNGSKNEVTVGAYCGFNVKNKFSFAYNYVINRNITPATKEQRDLLFQKINEAGYEWDAEKKELKKIEQNLAESAPVSTPMSYGKELEKRMCEACNRFFAPNTDSNRYSASDLFYAGVKAERDLNTLAWSEEDDQYVEDIIALIQRGLSYHTIGQVQEWLKSLKGRVQPKQEWSKEGEGYFDTLIGIMNERMNCSDEGSMVYNVYKKAQDWLKSLKGRVQPKQEWSEEDEEMLNSTILFVEHSAVTTICKEKGNVISWLKSLRPQNTWKPSDEQMMALLYYCSNGSVLTSLYNDLNKLKEE